MAWNQNSAQTPTTKHTCTPDGRPMPFGKLAPLGECPRCDERHAGAPAVKWNTRTTEPIRRGPCDCSTCRAGNSAWCTANQW